MAAGRASQRGRCHQSFKGKRHPPEICPNPCRRVFTETIALDLLQLQSDGIAAVWRLHLSAAVTYRIGNRRAAAALIELADMAEHLWSGRTADEDSLQVGR